MYPTTELEESLETVQDKLISEEDMASAATLAGTEGPVGGGGGVAATVIVPPIPLPGIGVPVLEETPTSVIWMGIALLEGFGASWKVATATTPSGITLLLRPMTVQMFELQATAF